MKAVTLVLLMLGLAACGGEESSQPPQTPPARIEVTGIVTAGSADTRAQSIVGKGAAGVTRMTQVGADGRYVLSVTDLIAPFLFSNHTSPTGDPSLVFMTAPAARMGVINVTPLTTLLTAQLFGVDPINAYANFGGTSDLAAQVSDAALQKAQSDLTQYLQEVIGVQVKSGTASFVDTAFSPTAGDSMYDTIQALNAKLTADGTSLKDAAAQVAFGVRACRTESIQVTIDGVRRLFCPVIKGGTPREADISIIDYQLKNIANDTLRVTIQGDAVLSAEYVTAGGRTFQCAAASCGLISLGTPAADLSRTLTFASTTLTGADGGVLMDGTFLAPTPSITLPLLPCTDDRFFVIFENHDVVANCVDTLNPIPISGTFGTASGVGRDTFHFLNSVDPPPGSPKLQVVLESGTPQPTIVSVYYEEIDPDTFEIRNRFLCRQAACNGITLGAVTIDNTLGVPIERRNLAFNDTVLTGLNADGSATGTSVTVRASFTTLRDPSMVSAYPPLVACDPSADTIAIEAFQASFNYCLPPNDPFGSTYRAVADFGDGHSQVSFTNDLFSDTMSVIFDNATGAIVEANLQISSSSEQFRCTTDCVGIAISAPNGAGERTVTFTNAVVHRLEAYPLPGDRTVKLNSPAIVVPPP